MPTYQSVGSMRFTLTAAFILIALLISNKEAIIFFILHLIIYINYF